MNTTTTSDTAPKTKNTSNPFARGATVAGKRVETWRADSRTLAQPLRWHKPRRIFVCAHGDLFHEAVPDEWLDRVFAVMARCPWHQFHVLTKRPDRARVYLSNREDREIGRAMDRQLSGPHPVPVLPNVWLGTSISDQASAEARIPDLLATPAEVRFLSAEPLLGPIRLTHIKGALWPTSGSRLDWVIVGGESGPNARPMHPDWARSLRDQCQAAGVSFFFKQWGEWTFPGQSPGKPATETIRWLREDGFVADDPISAIAPGGLDGDPGERKVIAGEEVTVYQSHSWTRTARVGKKHAGRLLDGRTHDDIPS